METQAYVTEIENRTGEWAILHCEAGDTYHAHLEDGAWWLDLGNGEPGQGPFEAVSDVARWLNEDC